jgi:lipopolysaccharide transport system ATP-binding protein
METLCDRVLWLEKCRMRGLGAPRQVVDAYRQSVAEDEGRLHREAKDAAEQAPAGRESAAAEGDAARRWGSRQAEIVALRLLVGGEERYHLHSGEGMAIELEVACAERLADFVFGIAVQTPRGVEVWGTNTDLEGWQPEALEGTARVRIECPELRLGAGEYVVDVAVHARDGAPYDYRRGALSFTVTTPLVAVGVYQPRHSWSFAGAIRWRQEGSNGG